MFNIDKAKCKRLSKEVEKLFSDLFPICRSITGKGVRQTLSLLQKIAYFKIKEIPSGTKCYDWTIPKEWSVKDAFIKDSSGKKVVDFKDNNLHLVSYSEPIDEILSFKQLKEHLHTLPNLPRAIPYRTSYYNKTWGFCLSHNQYRRLDKNSKYHVKINTAFKSGSLTLGEALIKGVSGKEYLIATYCCHPSLANDNLSGIVLWAILLRELMSHKTYHSYRFVIAPETIGAIAYLAQNTKAMKNVDGGFIITCVAGPGKFSYKPTYLESGFIDKVVEKVFQELKIDFIRYPFDINGSDERQYSAPFYRIPMGTICKDKYYDYDYYHSSLDNLDFIGPSNLISTFKVYLSVISKLETDIVYKSLHPYCEPMLSKRGLYPKLGGLIKQITATKKHEVKKTSYSISSGNKKVRDKELDAIKWLMFYSDGKTSLSDIADKSSFRVEYLFEMANILCKNRLLKKVR